MAPGRTVRSVSPRIVPTRTAAFYCGLTVKRFKTNCPLAPRAFPDGTERHDLKDIDKWLDSLAGGPAQSADGWLARLDGDDNRAG
jgi:hypothetical protein